MIPAPLLLEVMEGAPQLAINMKSLYNSVQLWGTLPCLLQVCLYIVLTLYVVLLYTSPQITLTIPP